MTSLPPALQKLEIEPVRRLRSPLERTLLIAPLGVAILALTPLSLGLRRDIDWLLAWGLSVTQLIVGLWCVGLAFRDSIPGRAASTRTFGAALTLAAAVVAAIALVTNSASSISPRRTWEIGAICFGGTLALAIPTLLIAGILCARAYPTRPRLTGLFCGLGAGLIADSGWRLFCHFSALPHLLAFHIAPALSAGLLGVLLSRYLSRAAANQ